jgi:hypothetical protein
MAGFGKGHQSVGDIYDIDVRRTGSAAAAAAGAIGPTELFIQVQKLTVPPVSHPLPSLLSEIVSPGHKGEIQQLAGIPRPPANAALQSRIEVIDDVEAKTRRACRITGTATVTPLRHLSPHVGQAPSFQDFTKRLYRNVKGGCHRFRLFCPPLPGFFQVRLLYRRQCDVFQN